MFLENICLYRKTIFIIICILIIQILVLLINFVNGFYKYFIMKEKNLIKRYGADSWVIITGASSGQGAKFAFNLAKRGFNICMIGSKRTYFTQKEILQLYPNVKTKVILKDFRKAFETTFFDDIQIVFNEIGMDCAMLINNVGYRVGWDPYDKMPSKYIRDTIATGTIVQSRLTHMIIPFFLKRLKNKKKSGLVNITAQCMHPNLLFGMIGNEISVPYLSVYEAANAFGFYQGSSIYKEYIDKFDILNITPGAVITENTECLSNTIFNIDSDTFVKQIIKMMGNIQGNTCAYWGHAFSNFLINIVPFYKNNILRNVGKTISNDFMKKELNMHSNYKYDL
jgi:17beta-estradiol 17-dehydrogenase / very-long-chain 3-oxoacyl-CoA reductase